MRNLLVAAVLCAPVASSAGGIDMGLSNPEAVAPAPAAAPAKSPAEGLKSLDAAMTRAEASAKELNDALASAQAVFASAPKDAVVDYRKAYLDNLGEGCRKTFRPGDVSAAATDYGLFRPVARFLACSALAAKQHSVCTAHPAYSTKAPKDGESAADYCLDAYFFMRFTEAQASGGDAAAVCRQANAARGGAGDATANCAKAAAGDCQGMVPLNWQPFEDLKHCTAVFGALKGEAGACAGAKKYDDMLFAYSCSDAAAVRAAKKGGGCGASALCAALVGGKVDACAPAFAELRDAYCKNMIANKSGRESDVLDAAAREWRAKNPPARTAAMNAVTEKRKAVDAQLVAIGAAIDSFEPKTEPGFPARVNRYRDIRRKVDAELSRFKKATEKPAAKR
ncbi:MAG: hypothetical protein SF051_15110 [Elusimicrobiota bacterium]|nr:hypothetical protein [Elusimicrobiota bacterium]